MINITKYQHQKYKITSESTKNIKVYFLIKTLFRDVKYIKLLKESLTPQHG
jgi:hypothetical protein